VARLGTQMELVQNALLSRVPSRASWSRVGVGLRAANRPPYAPIACAAWSSAIKNRMLGGRSVAPRQGMDSQTRRPTTQDRRRIRMGVLGGNSGCLQKLRGSAWQVLRAECRFLTRHCYGRPAWRPIRLARLTAWIAGRDQRAPLNEFLPRVTFQTSTVGAGSSGRSGCPFNPTRRTAHP
jgi:hypothetical protein